MSAAIDAMAGNIAALSSVQMLAAANQSSAAALPLLESLPTMPTPAPSAPAPQPSPADIATVQRQSGVV